AAARHTAPAMSPACRTTRNPATTSPCWRARSAAASPRSRRSCNDPGGHPHFALGVAPGPAGAGAALFDLVRTRLAMGGTGRVRAAAAAAGAGVAAQHAPRRVLGRAAGTGLVLARRDGRLVAPPGALVRTAGN